jgi:hypothetical protein
MSKPARDDDAEVPDGAAVFPLIPPELGINPLLLAALHAYVFLEGSESEVVHPEMAAEAMEYLATYFQRLSGKDLARAREDLETLVGFAKEQKWPKQQVLFLKNFLQENGVDDKAELPSDETDA